MAKTDNMLCVDCKVAEGQLDIRHRLLCEACFERYVSSKVLKRMESYRFINLVGDEPRKLLLPLSGGPSSLVLLYVLNKQMQRQMEKRNRTAYNIVIVHVRDLAGENIDLSSWQERIRGTFGTNRFLDSLALEDIFAIDPNVGKDLEELGLNREEGESDSTFVVRLFSSLKTATAQSDLRELLLRRLLIAVARKEGCEGILWGHSDSRLAAKALADVAKGRGGGSPNAIADGISPFGIVFNYPLRDLYLKELSLYIASQEPQLADCLLSVENDSVPVSIATRNTSIDDLLTGYINSQGVKYPSIMANVVRTTGKLQTTHEKDMRMCRLCSSPITSSAATSSICYGCHRMKQDVRT